jgi:hypothetical protein
MPLKASIAAAERPLPAFAFRWDAETEILSGRCDLPASPNGFTGSVELESPDGAVLVLETIGGVLCGIEVVVWPELKNRGGVAVPHAPTVARVMFQPPGGERSGVVEVETPIAAGSAAGQTAVHLTLGGTRSRSVRVAENVLADLDAAGQVTGLWLTELPPFPAEG